MAKPEWAYNAGGTRNVIVLGKTGCGKSTLANKIICKDGSFKIGSELQCVTAEVEMVTETVNIDGKDYKINMIDTVGFQDPTRHDSDIMKDIKKELRLRCPEGLNLIIFVYKNGRFTKDEQKIFTRISNNFSDIIKDFSLLVITNCDGKKPEIRKKIVQDFTEAEVTKKFGAMMQKGIYCVGLPDIKEINEQSMPTIMDEMKNDMIPIHKAIAEASRVHLQEQIQKKGNCTIL